MKKVLLALLGMTVWGAIAAPSEAAILSVGDGGKIINAPASVFNNAAQGGFEDPDFMLGFNEKQNVLLTENLAVDGGTIAAGTRVSSHMIFMNTPGDGMLDLDNILWEFDGIVLGVMSDRQGLLEAASNPLLSNPGTAYPGSFDARGIELMEDFYSGVGTKTLDVSLKVVEPGDWIRVVTVSSVPEPASILGLLTIAVLGGTSMLKRQPH